MGKGEIIEHLGSGQYTVKIIYGGRDRVDLRISTLNEEIATLQARIDAETNEYQKTLLKLQKAALENSKKYILANMPDDYETNIWCADETEDLAGYIGTIEIPGEDQSIHIQPGYNSNAAYNAARDGQLWPAIAGSADWAYFNRCLLPGWQKWKPTHRFAKITAIDYDADTCSIHLLQATSSQQALNVNQGVGLDIGRAGLEYTESTGTVPGWDQFKSDNPSHPLVTNSGPPEKLPSTNALVEQIKAIDTEVNQKHLYASDASYRNIGDHWTILSGDDPNPLLNERGDCEDMALTKADKLINELGIDPKHMQIATCYTTRGDYHALLTVTTSNHGILCLDVNTFGVKTKAQLEAANYYRFDLFLTNGADSKWANDIVEVLSVPIEYMNCNASAFAVGDTVVVKFEGQDFDQPKVIGFAEEPKTCANICFSMDGYSDIHFERRVIGWNPDSEVYTIRGAGMTEGWNLKRFMATFSWGDGIIHAAGGQARASADPLSWYISNKLKKYDSLADSFSSDQNLLIAKTVQYGCVLDEDIALFAGGCTLQPDPYPFDSPSDFQPHDSTQKYVRSTNAWAHRQAVPNDAAYCGNFSLNGLGYLVEGLQDTSYLDENGWTVYNMVPVGAAYKFDDATNAWASIPYPSPNGDWWILNSWAADGKGWVANGQVKTKILTGDTQTNIGKPDEHYITGAHFSFEPVSETWSSEKKNSNSLAQGDLATSKRGGATINVALGFGGQDYSGDYYNTVTQTWSSTGGQGNTRPMGGTAGGAGN
jgi:predicted transglutaminase-like cysteine proteinase